MVVLHGCTQTPEGYDRGTGWTAPAERCGYAVLNVEQQRANNMNGCFNSFEPGDMHRDGGEPASIKAMIDRLVADHAIDPARILSPACLPPPQWQASCWPPIRKSLRAAA